MNHHSTNERKACVSKGEKKDNNRRVLQGILAPSAAEKGWGFCFVRFVTRSLDAVIETVFSLS
jgi:hypothetical protein